MKEETRILLGLPSFRADVGMGRGFTEDCYIVASEYLKAKGFDPFSLEYACSQGFPLFKTYGSVDSGETEHTQCTCVKQIFRLDPSEHNIYSCSKLCRCIH